METEIAKSQAREQALASVADPKPRVELPGPSYSDPCLPVADHASVNLNPHPVVLEPIAVESKPCTVALNSGMSEVCSRGVPSLPVRQVHAVDADVGLLLASDVPEVLDPLEVKHSQGGGPYALRTSFGWAITGPLTPYRYVSRASSFLVSVDTELRQLAKDFYNRDFDESIADDQTELSQEEHRCMERMNQSTELKSGFYVIALPFKDRQHLIPNNRVQAEQRAMLLKVT